MKNFLIISILLHNGFPNSVFMNLLECAKRRKEDGTVTSFMLTLNSILTIVCMM